MEAFQEEVPDGDLSGHGLLRWTGWRWPSHRAMPPGRLCELRGDRVGAGVGQRRSQRRDSKHPSSPNRGLCPLEAVLRTHEGGMPLGPGPSAGVYVPRPPSSPSDQGEDQQMVGRHTAPGRRCGVSRSQITAVY